MDHEQEIKEMENQVEILKRDLNLITNQFTKDLLLKEISDKESLICERKAMRFCENCGKYALYFNHDDELGEICEDCYYK